MTRVPGDVSERSSRRARRSLLALALLALHWLAASAERDASAQWASGAASAVSLPERLSQTGLYRDGTAGPLAPGVFTYTPQYPLWSDGASKRRYVRLPEGSAIDASDPDHFQLPVGTRLWKEFSLGRRVETRYMERQADGSWAFATYAWDDAGKDAVLVPERGRKRALSLPSGEPYDLPSRIDCAACHEGRPGRVLGMNAVQLSPDRDPLAPHAEPAQPGDLDLAELVRRGLVRGLPQALVDTPPRVAAASATERAALGYLFGNCSSCHNGEGPLANLGLDLDLPLSARPASRARATNVERPSRYLLPGAEHSLRIAPGRPEASTLAYRMRSRAPTAQMPPFGTHLVDEVGLALIERWIRQDLSNSPSPGKAP